MKKILKAFIPPVIIELYNILPLHSLRKYWLKNKSTFNLDNDLKKMIDFFIQSKSYELMSNYWNYLNIENLKQIKEQNKTLKKLPHQIKTKNNPYQKKTKKK